MAHKEKYSRGQLGHMCGHYDRSKECGDNVDPALTPNNYNLAANDQPLSQLDKIHERLAEVPHRERKDLKVMVDWIITAPKDLPANEHPQFFESCYNFCRDRYGVENVVSAYVHVDEPNAEDHMHFAFVPVTKDGRWSAKDVVNLADLRSFHTELQQHVERDLGHTVGILNEATREGNKAIADLKRETAQKKLKEAEREAEQIRTSARSEATAEARRIVSKAQDEAERVKDTLEPIRAEYEAKRAFIREADKSSEVSMMYPAYAKVTEKGIFKKQRFVTVPAEEWEAKYVSANEKGDLQRAEEVLERRFQAWQQRASTLNAAELEDEVKELKKELLHVQLENQRLQREDGEILNRVNRVLSKLPKEQAQAFVEAWNKDGEHVRAHADPDLDR